MYVCSQVFLRTTFWSMMFTVMPLVCMMVSSSKQWTLVILENVISHATKKKVFIINITIYIYTKFEFI